MDRSDPRGDYNHHTGAFNTLVEDTQPNEQTPDEAEMFQEMEDV